MKLQPNALPLSAMLPVPSHVPNAERTKGSQFSGSVLFGGFLVCIGYYLGAKLGFSLTLHPRPVSVMWPPNSILLAALLLSPPRLWWFFLACALPAHLAVQLQGDIPLRMMICWAVSNATEALIGAGLIRLVVGGQFRFVGLVNVATFLVCGVFLGPFLSSFLDAAFVRLNNWGEGSYGEIWRIRFFSNMLASLAVAPMLVMWAQADYGKLRRTTWNRWLEAALLSIGLLLVGYEVFVKAQTGLRTDPAFLYIPLPFLLWAGVRFGGMGAVTAVFVTSLISIWGAAHGSGPFSTQSPEANALSLQIFLTGSSVLLLLLTAVMTDREQAQERFAKAFHSSPDAMFVARKSDGHIVEWNDRAEKLFGYSRRDAVKRTILDLTIYLNETDHHKVLADTAGGSSVHDLEICFLAKTGEKRQTLVSADTDEIAGETCLIFVVHDITDRRRLEEEAREVSGKLINAQEDERKRIARELHDDLNQRLALLSIDLDILGQQSRMLVGPTPERLKSINLQLNELMSEVHRLSYQMHPAKLEQLGLLIAARTFCREVGLQRSIGVHFEHHDVPRILDPAVALCLYRVLQEALQNSMRHSGSREIHVRLAGEKEQLRLVITDNGHGFDVESSMHTAGLGLVSMRERVRQVYGSIKFLSKPGAGARIEVTVPLHTKRLLQEASRAAGGRSPSKLPA